MQQVIIMKNFLICEVKYKNNGNLIYELAKNLLMHVNIEQGGGLALRAVIEKCRMSRIGGKRINPQQLDNTDSGSFIMRCKSSDNCDSYNSNIDRKLELEEFLHSIVDTMAPHDG